MSSWRLSASNALQRLMVIRTWKYSSRLFLSNSLRSAKLLLCSLKTRTTQNLLSLRCKASVSMFQFTSSKRSTTWMFSFMISFTERRLYFSIGDRMQWKFNFFTHGTLNRTSNLTLLSVSFRVTESLRFGLSLSLIDQFFSHAADS